MNHELLNETIDIIARQLLRDSSFCGSVEGRRLRELLWETIGKYQPKVIPPSESAVEPRTTRTVSLPVHLDNAISEIVETSGLSRDQFLASILEWAMQR